MAGADAGTPLATQTPGDCQQVVCAGDGGQVNVLSDSDVPDTTECFTAACSSGTASLNPKTVGTACTENGGAFCDGAGACVECVMPSQCPGADTECQSRTCNNHMCGVSFASLGTPGSQQTPGDCKQSQCDGQGNLINANDDTDVPVDSNECSADVCTNGVPSNPPRPTGTACTQSGGTVCDGSSSCVQCVSGSNCSSGVCNSNNTCAAPTCVDNVKNGNELAVDCGGSCAACTGVLHAFASGAGGSVAASLLGGVWSTQTLSVPSVNRPAIDVIGNGNALAVLRFTQQGSPEDQLVEYGSWSAQSGTWGSFSAIGSGITTREAPSASASSTGLYVDFQGLDFKHYFAAYDGAVWSPTAEAVSSFGPHAGDLKARGADATLLFVQGTANDLRSRDRNSGSWGAEQAFASGTQVNFTVVPALAKLTNGNLLATWVAQSGSIYFAIRSAGVWSAPGVIPSAFTNDTPSVVPMASGGAMLAFRGTNGALYYTLYSSGFWGAPAQVGTNTLVTGTPALAHTPGNSTVHLCFISTAQNDSLSYTAYTSTTGWSAPNVLGGSSLSGVAAAVGP